MKSKLLTIAVGLLCVGAGATGQDLNQYMIFGHGTVSCGTWMAERGTMKKYSMESWVLGFVSGAGFAGQKPLRNTDPNGIFAYIDTKCASDPLLNLAGAAGSLVASLAKQQP
jgi:hypothetical protein